MDAPKEYKNFIGTIKNRILNAQYDALKAVNKELVRLYWDIGRMIVQIQKQHGWGDSVVINLAKDLQKEFPGERGYSKHNLWLMVQLIGWSHNVVILKKCLDWQQRLFYLTATKKFGWSKRVLEHQIENKRSVCCGILT